MKALMLFGYALAAWAAPHVALVRVPDGGIQPHAALDARGTLHVIYLKGEAGAADIYYVRRGKGEQAFSQPLRVNSEAGSAVATGTIRGPQLAVTPEGRVHVAWNGSARENTPMLYTRLNARGDAFEPQRNLIRKASGLDGGGAVAADASGNVWVAWHAGHDGEANRRVWVARSRDGGATFAPEEPATAEPTGACACCGMAALADGHGGAYFFYRSAGGGVDRDMWLVAKRAIRVDPWKLKACPMSSASLAADGSRVLAAWETEQQVYWAEIDPTAAKPPARNAATGEGARRKHPVLARNARGEFLLAWTEGTGWKKGGALAWQVYDSAGRPGAEKGRADGVPVWSFAGAVADSNGDFTIIY